MNQQSYVLSVLIPAFNEEQTILRVLRKVLALGSLLKEVIVADDGSQECDPSEIPDVVGPILAGDADVVYGSRFLVRRTNRNMGTASA